MSASLLQACAPSDQRNAPLGSSSYASDQGNAAKTRHLHYVFDAWGNVTEVDGDLVGTVALQRTNPSGGGIAPAPTNAVTDGDGLPLTKFTRDTWGNVLVARSGDGLRVVNYGYDQAYDQLQTSVTLNPAANVALTTVTVYDRGLALPTTTVEPTGATTVVSYDPFGRVQTVNLPDPALGSAETGTPNLSVVYTDGAPFSRADITELTAAPSTVRQRSVSRTPWGGLRER